MKTKTFNQLHFKPSFQLRFNRSQISNSYLAGRQVKFQILSLILYSLFLILLPMPQAHAEGISLGVYPPIIKIEGNPPFNVNSPITLENSGDDSLTIEIQIKPFKSAPSDDGSVEFIPEKSFNPADSLIFQRLQFLDNGHVLKNIILPPRQQKTIMLHVGLPKDEVPADYSFSIVFLAKHEASVKPETEINGAVTRGGVATNLILSIGPKGKTSGQITRFSSPFFLNSGPVPFTVKLENTSSHSIAPIGRIDVKNIFGQYIGKVDLQPVTILSQSRRLIPDKSRIDDNGVISSVKNQAQPTALWTEKFLLGPYTAKVTLKLSDSGPVLTRTILFFAFPWQGLVLLFALGLSGFLLRKKILKRLGLGKA